MDGNSNKELYVTTQQDARNNKKLNFTTEELLENVKS
jgi:hypothetical protein